MAWLSRRLHLLDPMSQLHQAQGCGLHSFSRCGHAWSMAQPTLPPCNSAEPLHGRSAQVRQSRTSRMAAAATPAHNSGNVPAPTPPVGGGVAPPPRGSNGASPPPRSSNGAPPVPRFSDRFYAPGAQALRTRQQKRESLMGMDGVGPRNMVALHQYGILTVEQLREIFDRHGQDGAKMTQILTVKVGFRKTHALQTVRHLQALAAGFATSHAMEYAGKKIPHIPRLAPCTICVEGNISTGKSTFLRLISQALDSQDRTVQVVAEPLEQWQNVGGRGGNILDEFYKNPQRWAYTFQNYVFVTRVMQEQRSQVPSTGLPQRRLLERSVLSDRMVFVHAVREAGWMTQLEMDAYDCWFEPLVRAMPQIIPDGFVYLRANPKTCYDRLTQRSREEESSVSLEYLQQLHKLHDQWLVRDNFEHFDHLPLADRLPLPPEMLIKNIQFLDQFKHSFLPTAAHNVPVLVLNYNKDMDLVNDSAAKADYANKVWMFMDW
eukprot:CAMPEP_0206140292 /NCGR_PEP_ID=MMETSP1473-20131121/8937_1 /ASSEMBLY_ACC=CAM_ASM_001109 /TAXON_ID=1461547 /ORGANISM="Stichococcus sp, Strain RCC1054" /LENGTH=489 /DNA_ID=CAMNT_0053534393 /DNA_START=166 /DNA_END=1632 /DNA_ORIENTATION=-